MDPHHVTITLCTAAGAGVLLIALAERLRIPSIALLLIGGVLLGPEVLGLVNPLVLGRGLEAVVALAVAVILFEGGLTLDLAGFRREPRVIVRMLTLGVAVTWFGTASAVYFMFGELGLELSIIAGSLVIVTGPTVISPLLRRIGVQARLHNILYWEGVLVDAVGVFIAVLCYEWIASASEPFVMGPIARFASRFVVGAGVGAGAGLLLGFLLNRRLVSSNYANILVLATALLAFGASNAVLHESGVLAVIVAGFVVNLQRVPQLRDVRRFKLELTEAGVGLLFILLAAKLELGQFINDAPRLLAFLALVLLVLRPINVLLSTWGLHFSWQEKAFLSWLAPRGIVAASMASLLALRLDSAGHTAAHYLETLTYAVIFATVLLQGFSAPLVARLLGLMQPHQGAWLIIGHPTLAVELHSRLRQAGARSAVVAYGPGAAFVSEGEHASSHRSTRDSTDTASESAFLSPGMDPLEPRSLEGLSLNEIEAVLAISTDSRQNRAVCEAWALIVGEASCYRWDPDENGKQRRTRHGHAVWDDIPDLGSVVAGLQSGTHVVEAVEPGGTEDVERFSPLHRPLLAVTEGRISLAREDGGFDSEALILLRERVPGLFGLVRDAVIIDKENPSFEEVLRTLLESAERLAPKLDTESALAKMVERETEMPTAVGNGVAIPHLYSNQVSRSTAFVASVPSGLDMPTPDEELVQLVFLVVSPRAKAREHLRSLAAIAHLGKDLKLLDVLKRQRTRGRLLAFIRERE